MKKRYAIIVLLLIWTTAMIVIPIMESRFASEDKEYREYMHKMYEESLVVEEQFDETVTYCKEHEEDLMKVSEMFLEQYYENITSQATAEIAQNNTSPEWTELSEKLTLRYPTDNTSVNGKSVYYFCAGGGGSFLYIVYINAGDEAIYDLGIGGNLQRKKEKINDNLYVCIFYNPMIGL